jgi:hypothetical protein
MSHLNYKEIDRKKKYMNPVDWFNIHGDFVQIFDGLKDYRVKSTTEVVSTKTDLLITYANGKVMYDEQEMTLFQLLTIVRFKSIYKSAQNYVDFKIMNTRIPYIRVGTEYYKIVNDYSPQFGFTTKKLISWNKDTLVTDHGKEILTDIPLFDGFNIVPDNKNHKEFIDGNYNLYAPMPHVVAESAGDFPTIKSLMHQVFGALQDQTELGYRYVKALYQYPEKILPVLVLVSKERHTGKTTFLNFLNLLFGDNYTMIQPEYITDSFNASYATKNIIGIDEAVFDKSHVFERIKSLSTAKSIVVNQKNVKTYSIPFYGKLVITSNREDDFMRIDKEENRFWVRKIPVFDNMISDMEMKMSHEVPAFLHYLESLPDLSWDKSRMLFTQEEIGTQFLEDVKSQSRTGIEKELEICIEGYFLENRVTDFYATSTQLKKMFFEYERYSRDYISRILMEKFEMNSRNHEPGPGKYLKGCIMAKGRYYHFERDKWVKDETEQDKIGLLKTLSDDINSELPF